MDVVGLNSVEKIHEFSLQLASIFSTTSIYQNHPIGYYHYDKL